jgi:hypothetical protein
MGTPILLSELDTTVQELRLETHHRGFTQKLAHIVTALGVIPDEPPPGFGEDAMVRLRQLADETVDAVERRIDSDGDGATSQQQLAGTIYEIRRRMETIEMWFRRAQQS